MKVQLVRNATLLLDSSQGRILVDPMLRAAGTSPPIENTPNPKPNPLVELPMTPEEVLEGVDLCIVTHLHRDHFDDLVPLDLPILTQPESADELRSRGHTNVTTHHPEIPMTRGRHGTGEIGRALGPVSGWVVDGVYIAGDTILCDEVHVARARYEPRATIVNGDDAHPGRLRRADTVVGVLDRAAALAADTEPSRRLEIHVGRRLAARHLLRRDRGNEVAVEARRAEHHVDQLAVRRRGDRERHLRADPAHGLDRPRDERRRFAVARQHALHDRRVDLLRRPRHVQLLGHVPRPLGGAHPHHVARRPVGVRAAGLPHVQLAYVVPHLLRVDDHAVEVEDDRLDVHSAW
jgi:L-ascorbate metabolism protein UlaG (beta-lactamase superfamily)